MKEVGGVKGCLQTLKMLVHLETPSAGHTHTHPYMYTLIKKHGVLAEIATIFNGCQIFPLYGKTVIRA